jgi:hypothetical protein
MPGYVPSFSGDLLAARNLEWIDLVVFGYTLVERRVGGLVVGTADVRCVSLRKASVTGCGIM